MTDTLVMDTERLIDKNSPVPYYFQIERILEAGIRSGQWLPEQQIPTEKDLCGQFGVSRTVIRQAVRDLETRGLVWRAPGKGTFISKPKVREGLIQTLSGLHEEAAAQGRKLKSLVLEQKVLEASTEVAQALQLDVGAPVIFTRRVRLIDDEPHVLSLTYIPFKHCPGLVLEDLSDKSLYALLENKYGLRITHGHRVVEAVSANRADADLLDVKRGAALIRLVSISFLADGTPIEYDIGKHRGDRTRFEVELVRPARQHNDTYKE